MGVIHKLKPEIIEFVIQQKRDDPHLSCRKLVVIVSQSFQIQLSKSSINTIWKSANLSSAVGRRALVSKPKGFKLPAEKRQQLFPGQGPKEAAPSPIIPPASDSPEVKPIKIALERKKEKRIESKELLENAGSVFFKIGEWDLTENSLLGEILVKKLKGYDPLKLHVWANFLMGLSILGVKDLSTLPAATPLKGVLSESGNHDYDSEILKQIVLSLDNLTEIELNLSIELNQVNQWIASIKMSNLEGESFWIHPYCKKFLRNNVQSESPIIINKITKTLITQFIDNVQFVNLESITSDNEVFNENFYSFWSSGNGKGFKEITFYDLQGKELIQLPLSSQKKFFVSMIWPSQKEFQYFLAAQGAAREGSIYLAELGKEYFYQEILVPVENGKIRGFLLKDSLAALPLGVVITNASAQEKEAREILSAYLLRWPNLGSLLSQSSTRNIDVAQELEHIYGTSAGAADGAGNSLGEGFFCLLRVLHQVFLRYAQCQYFSDKISALSIDQFRESFISLPGYYQQTKGTISIEFVPPPGFVYFQELTQAVKRVNESHVTDRQNRRLFLNIAAK